MLTVFLLFAIMLLLVVVGVPLVYSIGVAATVIILGQGVGLFVYARNLMLIRRTRRRTAAATE